MGGVEKRKVKVLLSQEPRYDGGAAAEAFSDSWLVEWVEDARSDSEMVDMGGKCLFGDAGEMVAVLEDVDVAYFDVMESLLFK